VSFSALLNATLVIERSSEAVAGDPPEPVLDDYGQPVVAWSAIGTVRGRIRPVREREAVSQDQGGATVTDAIVYLLPTDVLPADRVRREDQPDGPWYELTGVRDAAGHGHHLECDARLVA
jgi:head-tail adaptor